MGNTIEQQQEEIKKLRGFLLEIMIRVGIDLPCHEDLIDLFDAGMVGQFGLRCAIADLLYDKVEEPPRLEPKEFILYKPTNRASPGEEFVQWAIRHIRLKDVYDQFNFPNDATNFDTIRQSIVNKINKIFNYKPVNK